MKIQIDTTAKTIKVQEKVKFSELAKALKSLFPNDEWKEYELLPEVITNFSNPIIIREARPWHYWVGTTCCSDPVLRTGATVVGSGYITTLGTSTTGSCSNALSLTNTTNVVNLDIQTDN